LKEAVVDTNVFIHAIVEDSDLHGEARALLYSLDRWYVPTIVLYELVWFFKRVGLDVAEVRRCIEAVLSSTRCVVVPDTGRCTRRALSMIVQGAASLKHFNDLVILSTAIETCRRIATYDGKLRSIAEKYGVEVLPKSIG